jgi:PIN domain
VIGMEAHLKPYYVILDANIWIAERLLQSSIGSAFLYAVTSTKSSMLLPEVVELEVARVLPDMAERSVDLIKREFRLLRQLSGHELTLTAPSALAITDGIKERWEQLSGPLIRIPFTYDQARSALQRVIRKAPPSGDNNEQFRDCCIWDVAVSMATERIVHLVSADNAFYENRNRAAGLASALRDELTAAEKSLHIHPSLRDFSGSRGFGRCDYR